MQMQVIFDASYPRSRCFRWSNKSLLLHRLLTCKDKEGLSRCGKELEPNLSHDVLLMACRASETCRFRRSAWLFTVCHRGLCPPAFVWRLADEKGTSVCVATSCTSEKTEQPQIISLSRPGLEQSLLAKEENESRKRVWYY